MNNGLNATNDPIDKQEYQYYAFISYSHKDMKWARWLQKKLETYKLPSKLQESISDDKDRKGNKHLIQPVFRDETSINPGKSVDDALKSELVKSKYLVVICSPASAASSWVDREVERFVELGREDRIMPFIVEGVPHSEEPTKECYPPALRALAEKKGSSILGSDVQARGKREAFLCTVAFLLGIDIETLRSREEERKRKRNLIILAVSLVFTGICVFLGVKAWNYFVPKVAYYQDYTLRFGLPEGIGKLTEHQTKSREEHYEITTQYGKIQSIAHKNSYGRTTDLAVSERIDRSAYMEFDYADDGNLISTTRYFANGIPEMIWKYTDQLRVVQFEYPERNNNHEIDVSDRSSIALTLSSDTQNMDTGAYGQTGQKSFIAGYMISYTDDGLVRDIYYCSMPTFGYRTRDGNGIYGLRYEYDQMGRITKTQYLNENNEPMSDAGGVSKILYTYDQEGQITRIEYQNEKDEPTKNRAGWAIDNQEFKDGNLVREETLDENGNRVINDQGWAGIDFKYDQHGNCIESSITGINGEPIADTTGWQKIRFSYDEQGRETERVGFGLDGQLALCPSGFASQRVLYDKAGNIIEMDFCNKKGEPTIIDEGYAIWKAIYNNRGKCIEQAFYDENNNLILRDNGYAKIGFAYDDHGDIIEYAYYDINNEMVLNVDGFARKEVQYDARGNITEETCYGTDGTMTNCNYGFAKVKYRYDEQGNVIEESYYDKDGEPVLVGMGFASEQYKYDDKGNKIETSYYGTSGQLKKVSEGYAGWTSKYDEFGNEIEISYFDANKNPVECYDGYAVLQMNYDSFNNPIETVFLDINRNQIIPPDDYNTAENGDNLVQESHEIIEYQVAFTDASISLPANWVYADRSIKEDSEFCIEWGITPKDFINDYLSYDHYAFAIDSVTGTGLFFDVSATELKNYSDMSKNEMIALRVDLAEWLTENGEKIISNRTIDLNRTYCKVVSKDDELTYYYYETVNNGEMFTFMFMIDSGEWDPSYEVTYDEIVWNSMLNESPKT